MPIRPVRIGDARRIAQIYNHYVADTIVTFELAPVAEDEIAHRIDEYTKLYPWYVTEEDDLVIGYAYASKFKEREAYRFAAELSIYFDKDSLGGGRGKALFAHLIEGMKTTPCATLIGGIALPNPASVRLHEDFGFEKVAHFKRVGYKLGKWIDVGYWQLDLKPVVP